MFKNYFKFSRQILNMTDFLASIFGYGSLKVTRRNDGSEILGKRPVGFSSISLKIKEKNRIKILDPSLNSIFNGLKWLVHFKKSCRSVRKIDVVLKKSVLKSGKSKILKRPLDR